ncbi:hypothetical protein CGRA01v4_06688 [Colletotrichum graminicola]|nr:hypothetical protein CGRA01v4_06688 [Colletotrichum graminicola]
MKISLAWTDAAPGVHDSLIGGVGVGSQGKMKIPMSQGITLSIRRPLTSVKLYPAQVDVGRTKPGQQLMLLGTPTRRNRAARTAGIPGAVAASKPCLCQRWCVQIGIGSPEVGAWATARTR